MKLSIETGYPHCYIILNGETPEERNQLRRLRNACGKVGIDSFGKYEGGEPCGEYFQLGGKMESLEHALELSKLFRKP